MSLKVRISNDMKDAMRSRQADRLSAIRLLLAAIKQKEIDERHELDDSQVCAIVEKLIKQRRDSIEQFTKAGRNELADRERFEEQVLASYMPAQLSDQEISAEIDAALAATGAAGPQDMGRVMTALKSTLAGRADMAAVSAQVKARLTR
ncbi:MAG: GatB/YqeY domain-containing protein [Quisquiliibacterium sp.]